MPSMLTMAELLKERVKSVNLTPEKQENYISQEFQDYGYRLALRLNDLPKKAIYIRFAKEVPRALLEDAAAFASTYSTARVPGKVFLWKLKGLMQEYKEKHPEFRMAPIPRKKRAAKVKKEKELKGMAKVEKAPKVIKQRIVRKQPARTSKEIKAVTIPQLNLF